ncbi:hypothetical protein NBRC110019_25090 [Neptunitalea chrysea]|uniref:Outer membrane protein beta-barrel domain-containing protein n=1 Tax=Neptunitalea chrysea TaxID=1647581 RepID=A0A9W6EWS2_9FLAO|nr:hypothetical protein [Neptunitalea chrysea]GLB53468.1 hypothetical protein NBRC110019_25090 [Neptunitalea chrysea]
MKKLFLLLALIVSVTVVNAQINYEKGYYITNSDEKVECFIKYVEWNNNPVDFNYRGSLKGDTKTIGIDNVKEFGVYNRVKYQRATVAIDTSSTILKNLNENKEPKYKTITAFLKFLVEGEANLYLYKDKYVPKSYLYNVGSAPIKLLVYKKYLDQEKDDNSQMIKKYNDKIAENNEFRKQLYVNLKCGNNLALIKKTDYKEKSLINFFNAYNRCKSGNRVTSNKKKKKGKSVNLNVKLGAQSSSLSFSNPSYGIDFDSEIAPRVGVEGEFVLPFHRNKVALTAELMYNSYKSTTTNTKNISFVSGGLLNADIDYKSLEVPLGARYYLYLDKRGNSKSKVFIDAAVSFDFQFGSSFVLKRSNGEVYEELDIKPSLSYTVGTGFKYDKYTVSVRYLFDRNLFVDYAGVGSNYNSLTLMVGYTVF